MNTFAKLLILGDAGVGKTSLTKRFAEGRFDKYESRTSRYNSFFQPVAVNDETIKFYIKDFGGKDTFFSSIDYPEADAAMIVYDITNKASFRRVKKFVNQVREKCKLNVVMALAGNKADLLDARKVAAEEAQVYAQENGLFFMETSAKTETNVYDMFYEIAKRLPVEKRLPNHQINPTAGFMMKLFEYDASFAGFMMKLFKYGASFFLIFFFVKALLWVFSFLMWVFSYVPIKMVLQVIFVLLLSLVVLFCCLICCFSRMRLH